MNSKQQKHKNSVVSSSAMLDFEQFVRKRNETFSIVKSSTDPIENKVRSFHDLLKLNKTGCVMKQAIPSGCLNGGTATRDHPLSECSKETVHAHALYEDDQEEQIHKFSRMTAGIHEWENSKKPSQHEKPFRVEKRSWQDLNLSKFKMAETVVERRDRVELGELWQTAKYWSQASKLLVNKSKVKKCIKRMQNKISRNGFFRKSVPFQSLDRCPNFIEQKKSIKALEEKAKSKYGLSFQGGTKFVPVQVSPPDTEFQQLQTGLRKAACIQSTIRKENNYLQMLSASAEQVYDSSVPCRLLSMITQPTRLRISAKGRFRGNNYIRIC